MSVKKLLKKLDGWKTIIAYVLAQIPWFTSNPLVLEAVNKVLADPNNTQAWVDLIIQVIMVIGVADIVRKNLVYGTARTRVTK